MKTILKRISAGVLAAVFLAMFAVPRSRAVTGVDDTTLGIMAVIVHLQSIGGDLAVTQGTALATTDAVTSLATQAGAAGAFGAGVSGATALATIGAGVTAAAGGFTIGYAGYETLSKLAEWIRQSKLTGTVANKIYQTGGPYNKMLDGTSIHSVHNFGDVVTTQAGSSFWLDKVPAPSEGDQAFTIKSTFISTTAQIYTYEATYAHVYGGISLASKQYYLYTTPPPDLSICYPRTSWDYISPVSDVNFPPYVFGEPSGSSTQEKQEVTYIPPVTWSPPAPSLGEDVLYQPYPNQPDKPLTDIAQDVPQDIYDKQLNPLPPVVVTPTTPPVTPPDVPPVNPNPDVDIPEDVAPYTVKLGDVFPFCIPFDVYHMVTMFAAEPEAPAATWEFTLPWSGQECEVSWSLEEWDEVAKLCRSLELVLFCVGLAVATYKMIKW